MKDFLESHDHLGRRKDLKEDSLKNKWLDKIYIGKDDVKNKLWGPAEDLMDKKSTEEWDSFLDFGKGVSGIEGSEKWDTADEDLKDLHVKGLVEQWDDDTTESKKSIKKKHLADGWESNDIDNLKIKPMSFTGSDTHEREWRQASRTNLIDDLNDMAEIQWKIISALKKVERNSKENTDCNLRDLAQKKAAITDLEASLDLDNIDEPPDTSELFHG